MKYIPSRNCEDVEVGDIVMCNPLAVWLNEGDEDYGNIEYKLGDYTSETRMRKRFEGELEVIYKENHDKWVEFSGSPQSSYLYMREQILVKGIDYDA